MKKKCLSAAIAVSMLLSGLGAVPIYASEALQQNVSASYEGVLTKVKQKITVPDNMTKFDMNISESHDGGERYYFNWQTANEKNYSNANMSVTADKDGKILNYYYFNSDYSKNEGYIKIADIIKSDVRAEIENQLKKIIPEKFDKMEAVEDIAVSGNEYYINYYHIENGMKVYNDYVNVSAVLYDGKVILRNINSQWHDTEFTVPDSMISYEQASAVFKDKARFYLNYGTKYKSANKYSAFFKYSFENTPFIDAVSAEVISGDGYQVYGMTNGTAEDASADKYSAGGISPIEQAEIDKVSGLLSYEDAENKLRLIKELNISDDMQAEGKSITKKGEEYIMRFEFSDEENKEYIYVWINAENGDLYHADNYSDYEDKKIELSKNEKNSAVAKIKEFAEKYTPEYYKNTVPTEPVVNNENVSVRFERIENGIPVENDGITIQWNAKTDKFVRIHTNKTNIVEFEKSEKFFDEASAYEAVLKNAGFEKIYVMHDEKMTVAYAITNIQKAMLDGVTGEAINSNGDLINVFDGYTDIRGHWAENVINTLADYNIKKYGGEFNPDENITQSEFLSMLYSAQYMYTPDNEDGMYSRFVRQGVIGEADINPTGTVTKQQAVIYLLKAMGRSDVAELSGIYKCDFNDAEMIDEKYFGYVAIAKGMGIVKGDESNNFNPNKNVTNAEAAAVIYNYLRK